MGPSLVYSVYNILSLKKLESELVETNLLYDESSHNLKVVWRCKTLKLNKEELTEIDGHNEETCE